MRSSSFSALGAWVRGENRVYSEEGGAVEHLRHHHAARPDVHLVRVALVATPPQVYRVLHQQLRSAVVARDHVARQVRRVRTCQAEVAQLRGKRGKSTPQRHPTTSATRSPASRPGG